MSERAILGRNVNTFRNLKGLTQKELARKVGLTSDTISKLERGVQENIGMKYLILIQKELDVALEELFMVDPEAKVIKLVISDENFQGLQALLDEFVKTASRLLKKGAKEAKG